MNRLRQRQEQGESRQCQGNGAVKEKAIATVVMVEAKVRMKIATNPMAKAIANLQLYIALHSTGNKIILIMHCL